MIAIARQAAQTAEDARLIAVTRQQQEFVAQQQAVALQQQAVADEQGLWPRSVNVRRSKSVSAPIAKHRRPRAPRPTSNKRRDTAIAREKLARASGILAAQPDLHIMVEGHTDDVGDADRNQRLSEQRAQSVLTYLVQQKIPLTAVDVAGFGESRPAAPNDTAQGRQQNRRVEIIVTGEPITAAEAVATPQ